VDSTSVKAFINVEHALDMNTTVKRAEK